MQVFSLVFEMARFKVSPFNAARKGCREVCEGGVLRHLANPKLEILRTRFLYAPFDCSATFTALNAFIASAL